MGLRGNESGGGDSDTLSRGFTLHSAVEHRSVPAQIQWYNTITEIA